MIIKKTTKPAIQFVLVSTAIVLLATALVKAVRAFQGVAYLSKTDDVFNFLDVRELLIIAAVFEIVVGLFLLLSKDARARSVVLLATANLFIGYRIVRLIVGASGTCLCLGYVGQWFRISPVAAAVTSYALFTYVVAAAYFVFWKVVWSKPTPAGLTSSTESTPTLAHP